MNWRAATGAGLLGLLTSAATAATNDIVWLNEVVRGKNTLEQWHDHWSETLTHKVAYFDGFFGDERMREDTRTTRLSLRVGVRVDRRDDIQLRQGVDIRLALPRLEDRLQLLLDNTLDVDEGPFASKYEEAVRETPPDAGLRYILSENKAVRITSDAGVRLGDTPQVFGRTRARYTRPFDVWELRLSERLQWYSEDGFGALSDTTWDRNLATNTLLRFRTTLDWQEDERGVEPGQAVTLFHHRDRYRSLSATLRANWPETPHGGKAVYGIETRLRRLVHSDWIYAEVTPGLEYLQEDGFGWNPFVLVGFEFRFERDPTPGS